MIGMLEINLFVDLCTSGYVQQVLGEWGWISILPGDLVEGIEVHTWPETSVLFPDEAPCKELVRCSVATAWLAVSQLEKLMLILVKLKL